MAKFTAYVSTWVVNSEYARSFEVDDEELEGLSEEERNTLLDEYAQITVEGYYQIGWREGDER